MRRQLRLRRPKAQPTSDATNIDAIQENSSLAGIDEAKQRCAGRNRQLKIVLIYRLRKLTHSEGALSTAEAQAISDAPLAAL